MASFSVLVPTYRRPDDLRKCLLAIKGQSVPAMEVIVVRRDTDLDTKLVITQYQDLLPIIEVVVSEPGVVHAMTMGVAVANADYIAITDDDAEPGVNWLDQLAKLFATDSRIGGVGGRDIVTLPDGSILFDPQAKVGLIKFTGKMIGGHHCGTGGSRAVDVLKGVNCAYRRDLLQNIGFDRRLLGSGAQTHWEVSLGNEIARRGYRLIYDPAITVLHHPGARHDADQRAEFNDIAFFNNTHNELVALGTAAPTYKVLWYFCFMHTIGHKSSPGLIYSFAIWLVRGDRSIWLRLKLASRARVAALRTLEIIGR